MVERVHLKGLPTRARWTEAKDGCDRTEAQGGRRKLIEDASAELGSGEHWYPVDKVCNATRISGLPA